MKYAELREKYDPTVKKFVEDAIQTTKDTGSYHCIEIENDIAVSPFISNIAKIMFTTPMSYREPFIYTAEKLQQFAALPAKIESDMENIEFPYILKFSYPHLIKVEVKELLVRYDEVWSDMKNPFAQSIMTHYITLEIGQTIPLIEYSLLELYANNQIEYDVFIKYVKESV